MKTYGACPAMPSPGSARTAGIRMGLGTSESISDFRFRIADFEAEVRRQMSEDRCQMSEVRGPITEDRSQILGDR